MLKDITTLQLLGANFTTTTDLPLLKKDGSPAKAALLYGRNGSGKSTIAKAFRKVKGADIPSVQTATLKDKNNVSVALMDAEKAHIFVFDEDFVNDNVRVREDGLGSIVMLGEQAGLADQIATATQELQTAEADRDQKKRAADEYVNLASDKSPGYYLNKMKNLLQQDEGWAGRKRIIEELRRNASVSDYTYRDFINLNPTKTRDELLMDYNAGLRSWETARSGASTITATVPTVPQAYRDYETEIGNRLLQQIIEHPELTERERHLLDLVQQGHGEEMKQTAQEFSSSDILICPKCYQPLSLEYKLDLIESIERVLSEELKIHQRHLKTLQISLLEMDLNAFQALPAYQACMNKIAEINNAVQNNNALIQMKYDDPYTPVEERLEELSDQIASLTTLLTQLETEKQNHNRSVTDVRAIKTELTRINNEIAYWDVIELSRMYDIRSREKAAADDAYRVATTVVAEKQTRINDLNAQRDRIQIAIDLINDGLKYIFFSENRLQIEISGRDYKLVCNGHPVRPKDVSVGERNIIGLCYFFTRILQGKNLATAYGEEYLLVIDDPVSSFDLENRIGILSYLKYEMGKILLGNKESRALVMTHDLLTFYDVEKILEELNDQCKTTFQDNNIKYEILELKDTQTDRFKFRKRNEYSELLKMTYQYANGQATEYDIVIGNVMRQVLEAFATFEYRECIEKVSLNPDVLTKLEGIDHVYRAYFENLMYRLVMHGGSHRENQTRAMDLDFFTLIAENEKRRTAKEILCFIYLLNGSHIKSHLVKDYQDAESVIVAWCEGIRSGTGLN